MSKHASPRLQRVMLLAIVPACAPQPVAESQRHLTFNRRLAT